MLTLLSKLNSLSQVLKLAKGKWLLLLLGGLLVVQQVNFSCQESRREGATNRLVSENNVTIFQKDEEIKLLDKKLQKEIERKDVAVKELYEFKAKIEAEGKITNVKTKIVYKDKEVISYKKCKDAPGIIPGGIYRALDVNSFKQLDSFNFKLEDDTLLLFAKATPNYTSDSDENPFDVEASYKLNINIVGQVLKTIEDAGDRYHMRLFRVKGNEIVGKVPLQDFHVMVKDFRASRIRWWTPKIDLGIVGALQSARLNPTGSIGFSTSGYGKSAENPYFRFPRFSIDFMGDEIGLGVSPVVVNLGTHLPIINDLYTGIHLGMNTKGKYVGVLAGTSL